MRDITWPQFLWRLLGVGIVFVIVAFSMAIVQVHGDTWYINEAPKNTPLLDATDSSHRKYQQRSADICMVTSVIYFFIVILIFGHGRTHRRIIYLRAILLISIMYVLRSITINLTMLPPRNVSCRPKHADSTRGYLVLALEQFQGNYTCTDQVFSGHTLTMVLGAVLADTYILRVATVEL
jgi:hypothetical protein